MKKIINRLFSVFLCCVCFLGDINVIYAKNDNNIPIIDAVENMESYKTNVYAYNEISTYNGVTLKVEWNDPILGQPTNFHVSAIGGSGNYSFRMDAPSYSSPNIWMFESVADPSRGEWINYTSDCNSYDYKFTMTASGTYNFKFYLMDKINGVYYLRVNININVLDKNFPSVDEIVHNAVVKCNKETDGSDYQKALWLHDWLLDQLEYDVSLKWSSAESALTRGLGTCQAYESAYSMLLSAADIENSETRDTYDGHTWNAVKLDGKWYQIDCTWDDTNDNWYDFDQRHLYFGLTDELMALAHPGHSKIYTANGYSSHSNSLDNNFYVKNGDAYNWSESYIDRIKEKLNDGETEFIINADNAFYPPSISGIQNGIIAYILNQRNWETDLKKVVLKVVGDSTEFVCTAIYTEKEHVSDDDKILNLDKLANKNMYVLEDGKYVIKSGINEKYVLDVYGGSLLNEANVQLYSENESKAQSWLISHDEKGYVIITNEGSGKVLDVEGGSEENGANVQQYDSNLTRAQKWIAVKKSDGSVELISALDQNKCMDLNGAKACNGSNIQIYEKNDTNAQRWIFIIK